MENGNGKIFNFRPAAFAAVFLCLGIFFAYGIFLKSVSAWWLLCILPLAVTPFFFRRKKRAFLAVGVLILSFFVGFGLFSWQTARYADTQTYTKEEIPVAGQVVSVAQTDWGYKVILTDLTIGSTKADGQLVAYLPTSLAEDLRLADVVLLHGRVQTQTEFFDEYGFRAERIADDIRYTMQAKDCTVKAKPFSLVAFIRQRMKDVVYTGMDETSAVVTLALLTGDDSGIGEGLLENVRHGGIAHVFAVSGLHIGVLFGFTAWIAEKTRLRKALKWLRFLFSATVILFYGALCGYSASVVRAITMCLCLCAARLIGLTDDFLETLGLSAIVVLLRSPVSLFAVGFQLSFGACLGIALLDRPIRKGLDYICAKIEFLLTGKDPEAVPRKLRNEHPPTVRQRVQRACLSFLSLSTSAQIATAPLSLATFGYLSGWAFFLNILFVPLISAGFAFLLAFVLLASVLPIAWSGWILYAPSVTWSALVLLFQTVDFSSFALSGLTIGTGGLICYYIGLTFISDKFNLSKIEKLTFVALSFLAFGLTVFALNV